jgi:hypothetical protein
MQCGLWRTLTTRFQDSDASTQSPYPRLTTPTWLTKPTHSPGPATPQPGPQARSHNPILFFSLAPHLPPGSPTSSRLPHPTRRNKPLPRPQASSPSLHRQGNPYTARGTPILLSSWCCIQSSRTPSSLVAVSPQGRVPFLGKPPCPRWEVPSAPLGRFQFPRNQPSPHRQAPFTPWGRPIFPGNPTFSPPGGSFHSTGNAPSPRWEVNLAPRRRHSPPKCPRAHPN